VLIAAGDTFRAAAVEQLQVWAERAGAAFLSAPTGADAAGLAFDALAKARAEDFDVVLIDTAGRLQNKQDLMLELTKMVRVLRKADPEAPHEVLLVLDATVGRNAVAQENVFGNMIGVTGIVMTKLDGTARGGVLVPVAQASDSPIKLICVGEGVDDLRAGVFPLSGRIARMSAVVRAKPLQWLHVLGSVAPAIGFLITLLATRNVRDATWVIVDLAVLFLAVSLILERRVAPLQAFSAGAAILFGGMSLALHRIDVLQMKMTIVDGLFGAVLFGSLLLKRHPMKLLMSGAIDLPDHAWRTLALRYAVFFWASALANEVIRRTQTVEVWGAFRVAGVVAIFIFGAAQMPLIMKYWQNAGGNELPEPPEAGF
jgi:intracellular septation protein A